MSRRIKCGISELNSHLSRDVKRIKRADMAARFATAQRAARVMQARVPKAFGELKESIVGYRDGGKGDPATVASAPHAAAVEVGSAPHTPNMEALIRWVKLRGMQGLTGRGRIRQRFKQELGPTTPRQARRVTQMLMSERLRGTSGGKYLPIDAPEKVAAAIAKGIESEGTPPHFYAKNTVPWAGEILLQELKRRIKI